MNEDDGLLSRGLECELLMYMRVLGYPVVGMPHHASHDSTVGNIGGAVGNTISGAIWTNMFEKALKRNLPPASQSKLVDIYSSLDVQLEYAVGSPTRSALQESYGYAQAKMLAAGTGKMGLALIWMFLIKNVNVGKVEQVKGMVF